MSRPSSPRQFALDFAAPAPGFDNFVIGRNAELVARLTTLDFPAMLYLWGDAGSGKSHLAQATLALHGARVVVADDVGSLDSDEQQSLFDAFNATLQSGPPLVVTGDRAPLELSLREDLRTRLGAGLVHRIEPLSDDEKRVALSIAARDRGLDLGDDATAYLLNRFDRDMRSLMALLDSLDRYALEHRRALTLPLVRQWLNEGTA
ncbi:DnaA regulatory inactivator Hda [soil metagenome]